MKKTVTSLALTDKAVEKGAKALAEALNGGRWEVDYAECQRELWRKRVRAME